MQIKQSKRQKQLQKAWDQVEKQERKVERAAIRTKHSIWKKELEQKIPEKIYKSLNFAFYKGFSFVFEKGKVVIERSVDRNDILGNYRIRDYAIREKGGAKEWKRMRKSSSTSDLPNLAVTTVEGIGFGVLGIGMPDIVFFLGMVLKGIYETALAYGFSYDSRREQMLILKMMAAALSSNEERIIRNQAVEEIMALEDANLSDESFQEQLKETASVFAVDMLLLKFLQGIPIAGILGGAANPVYYSKIMKYVQIKYYKRYLRNLMTQ